MRREKVANWVSTDFIIGKETEWVADGFGSRKLQNAVADSVMFEEFNGVGFYAP
jgi:hypothetical protein